MKPNYGRPDCDGAPVLDGDSVPGVIVVTCPACPLHYTTPRT